MIAVLLVIAVATSAGVIVDRRSPHVAHRLSDLIVRSTLWVLLPFVVLMITPRIDYGQGGLAQGIGLGYLTLSLVGLLTWWIGSRVLRLAPPQTGALICGVILANTGYLGVPVVHTLLGSGHVPSAVIWDVMVTGIMQWCVGFAVGAAFGTRAGVGFRARAITFFTRNPVLLALVVGNLVPASWSPDLLYDVAEAIAGYGVLPLGFFLLGVNLTDEQRGEGGWLGGLPRLTGLVATAVAMRVVVAPLVLAGLVLAFAATVPSSFYLQAAMPAGINTLVIAHTFGLDVRLTAGTIAWSTIIVLVGLVALSFLL